MLKVNYNICDDCCTCISICPESALIYKDNLQINHESCILCGKCVKICPFAALEIENGKGLINE